MKKLIFTLMMAALSLIVINTFGQMPDPIVQGSKFNPYPGGSYDYTLSDMKFGTAGGVYEITATDATFAGNITVSDVGGNTGNYTLGSEITVSDGTEFDLVFTIDYPDAAAGTSGIVTVTATVGSCSNFINLPITVLPLPDFELTITVDETTPYCQSTNGTPDDNVAASVGQTNTITFTVTPIVTGVYSDYSYNYSIDLSGTGLDAYQIAENIDGDGSLTGGIVSGTITGGGSPTADTFTITFNTTTGSNPVIIPAAITSASLTIDPEAGGREVTADDTNSPFTVSTMPAIGSFN